MWAWVSSIISALFMLLMLRLRVASCYFARVIGANLSPDVARTSVQFGHLRVRRCHLGADPGVRKGFQQDRVAHAPIEDVCFRNALTQRVDAAFHLGNHALVNYAAGDELLCLRGIERRDKLAIL